MHTKKIRKPSKCLECSSNTLIEDYDRGEIICQSCGLVTNEKVIDRGPERRAFTKEEKQSRARVGAPMSYSIHDKGLPTVIDRITRDARGTKLPISTRLEMLRLRKWQIKTTVKSSKDRNLARAMTELDRLTDNLHIPVQVKERAAIIYRKALDNGLVRGRSISAIAAAATLYAACRVTETPRTLREVASVSSAKKKDVTRYYRLLLKELDIKMPVEDPVRCISKIALKVKIPTKTERTAIRILGEAKQRGLVTGKKPMGLAATALYIACVLDDVRKTQKEIAEAANVTEVTVRNRQKGLRKALELNV